MSWSVEITAKDKPPMNETVSSFCDCPGNICTSITLLGYKKLPHLSPDDRLAALADMIIELNKGNEGKFNDAYMVECDKQWSGGRESKAAWDAWWRSAQHMSSCPEEWKRYESFTGSEARRRMLADAERFYLLMKAGYEVNFVW